ncbi:DUF2165 family protein [Nocardia sp. NBC_00416]|uniref:DUF2165 family protein n=1 Tax=Nocardia sp. NBC_00416 TaxID=2975991 RepID=UPI002E1A8DFF
MCENARERDIFGSIRLVRGVRKPTAGSGRARRRDHRFLLPVRRGHQLPRRAAGRALATRSGAAGPGADRAATLSSLGWTMAVLLFAGGFLTVGGEWFRMWANEDVNASSAALQNFLIAAVGLILVHLPDSGRPGASPSV